MPRARIVIEDFSGGLSVDHSPYMIGESFATAAVNVRSEPRPKLSPRLGTSLIKAMPGSGSPTGLFYLDQKQAGGQTLVGVGRGAGLYTIDAAETTWTTVTSTAMTGAGTIRSVTFRDKRFLVNGTVFKMFDPTEGTVLQNVPDSPAPAKFIELNANRLYLAGDPDYPSTVYFSALREYDDWSSVYNSGQITVEGDNNDAITGMKKFGERLFISKEGSMHTLYGTGPLNYRLGEVYGMPGTIANDTMQGLEGYLLWLGRHGVYAFSGSDFANVAYPHVQAILDRINLEVVADEAKATTFESRYYLALPLDESPTANVLLVLDMKNQESPYWTMYDLETQDMLVERLTGGLPRLSFLTPDGYYCVAEDGTKDRGAGIAWEWRSKVFDMGTSLTKSPKTGAIFFEPGAGSVKLQYSLDPGSNPILSSPFEIDLSNPEGYATFSFPFTAGENTHGRSLQFFLSSTNGRAIINRLDFEVEVSGAPNLQHGEVF